MDAVASDRSSLSRYFLLLFGLCIPLWVIGAIFDVQLFAGFKLFQAGLAMPMIASLLLTYHERGWAGTAALLRRTYDVNKIKPRIVADAFPGRLSWLLHCLLHGLCGGAGAFWLCARPVAGAL
jgi:hypothetical protein